MPLFLFAAAGAMVTGGMYLFREAQREEARQEAASLRHGRLDALEDEIKLQDLRRQAKERGMTDEQIAQVEEGARAVREGEIGLAQIEAFLKGGGGA